MTDYFQGASALGAWEEQKAMDELTGKGMYIWVAINAEGGDPDKIAEVAYQARLSHVLIKIADGVGNYNISADIPAIVAALRAKGIGVWGWHYVYGYYPEREAAKAINRMTEFGLDGYVIDAESEYKGRNSSVAPFMTYLRAGLTCPIALSSYRYPSYHPSFPWKEFIARVDLNMPQVYWLQANNPAEQLEKSYNEFKALSPNLPFIPTGAAWKAGDWQATPANVVDFMDKARALGITAVNFWDWQHCRKDLPDTWQAIADYDWPTEQPEPEPLTIEQRVTYLESLHGIVR